MASTAPRRRIPQWAFWLLAALLMPVILFAFGLGAGFSDAHREDGGGTGGYIVGYAPAALLSLAWAGCIAGGVLGMMRQAVAERWSGVLVLLMSLIVVAIIGGLMALVAAVIQDRVLETVLRAVFLATAVGLSLVYWRRIDEAAREAQKTAWFWGSMGGVALLGAVEPLTRRDGPLQLPLLVGGPDPHAWLLTGAAYLFLAQASVATVIWVLWWIRAR